MRELFLFLFLLPGFALADLSLPVLAEQQECVSSTATSVGLEQAYDGIAENLTAPRVGNPYSLEPIQAGHVSGLYVRSGSRPKLVLRRNIVECKTWTDTTNLQVRRYDPSANDVRLLGCEPSNESPTNAAGAPISNRWAEYTVMMTIDGDRTRFRLFRPLQPAGGIKCELGPDGTYQPTAAALGAKPDESFRRVYCSRPANDRRIVGIDCSRELRSSQ